MVGNSRQITITSPSKTHFNHQCLRTSFPDNINVVTSIKDITILSSVHADICSENSDIATSPIKDTIANTNIKTLTVYISVNY